MDSALEMDKGHTFNPNEIVKLKVVLKSGREVGSNYKYSVALHEMNKIKDIIEKKPSGTYGAEISKGLISVFDTSEIVGAYIGDL